MKLSSIQRIGEFQISENNVVLLFKHIKNYVVKVINFHNGDIIKTVEKKNFVDAISEFVNIIEVAK